MNAYVIDKPGSDKNSGDKKSSDNKRNDTSPSQNRLPDRAWLLNPGAIKAARRCITAVEKELGVKIKLSHPHLLEIIQESCELADSRRLRMAYRELMVYEANATETSKDRDGLSRLPGMAGIAMMSEARSMNSMNGVKGAAGLRSIRSLESMI